MDGATAAGAAATATPVTPVVEVRGASFGYGATPVLKDISFTLAAGEAAALVGPNGSGKSTLLAALIGLNTRFAGSITVLGLNPRAARERVGVLPQRDSRQAQLPVTVRQVVGMGLYRGLGLKPFGVSGRERVARAIAQVGLSEHAGRLFGELSGGQQQRAILARALVADPGLLLLDEPFNGLDHPNRQALLETIGQLRQNGCAVVVSTHDLEIARDACSHVLLLDRRQVAFGPVAQTLTLKNVAATFHDTTVEIDSHSLTTRHEAADHTHHDPA